MKIGISTSVIQRGRSGVAQHVFALVRALQAHAAQHHFTLFVLEQDRPLFDFAAGRMEIVPVPERYRRPVADIAWHQLQLPGMAARLGLDVLHVPSYRRMLWRAPCARVATIHDLAAFHVAGKYDWARMFYGRVVARQLARQQDEIIAVSQATARDLARFFQLDSRKVTVIPNGLDHDRFKPAPAAGARAWAEAKGVNRPFFLYVSRLEHPGKNHLRLIEAFNQFKTRTGSDWLLVLGGSDWHGAGVIHRAVDASPHAADIRRLGFVPDADLPRWYQAAGAMIYPSLFEGFGMPPLEAMACGCPVASSARGALAETLGEAAAIIEPEDTDGIAWELGRLAMDGAWRATLRAVGLKHAANYHWQRNAAATMATYARAAASRGAHTRARCGLSATPHAGAHLP
ncbi:MAG TPA: glycosyltransferase family 1 protein [Lacunisphaera sp.]|nr:glycosyltransferase family 1 protein [Lacunisphaera sp.]